MNTARSIKDCLEYLYREASDARLTELAMMIGTAALAAEDVLTLWRVANDHGGADARMISTDPL